MSPFGVTFYFGLTQAETELLNKEVNVLAAVAAPSVI